jgi:uncharacterized double-CXXCG motif protein
MFEVLPDEASWGTKYRYSFDVTHRWGLPGVNCPRCSSWATIGLAYPSVDLSSLPNQEEYTRRWPVPPQHLDELRRTLMTAVPAHLPLKPGTKLGPLTGKAKGTFGDFAWPNSWTLLVRRGARDLLQSAGVKLPESAATEISYRSSEPPDLLELQIEPRAKLSVKCLPEGSAEPCPVCTRRRINAPERIVLQKDSLPSDVDLFRIVELPTYIVATSRFADAAQDLRLSDIVFKEIEVE